MSNNINAVAAAGALAVVQVSHAFDFIIDPYKTDLNPAKPEDRKMYLAACKDLN